MSHQLSQQEIQNIGQLLLSPDENNYQLALSLLNTHPYAIPQLRLELEVFCAFNFELEILGGSLDHIFPDFHINNPVYALSRSIDPSIIMENKHLVQDFLKCYTQYERLIDIDPERTVHYANFADILEHFFKDYDHAYIFYQKGLTHHPDKAWIHYQYANSLVYRRPSSISLSEATPAIVNSYQRAYELKSNPKALYALSLFYKVDLQDYAAAQQTYLQCIKDHPTHIPAINGYAMLLFEMKQYPLALKFAKEALSQIKAQNNTRSLHHVYDTIANIYAKGLGATQKALHYFEKAIDHHPGHTESIDSAIHLLREEKSYILLLHWLKKKLNINSMDLLVLQELAETYSYLEDDQNATLYYEKALKIYPNYHIAKEGLAKLANKNN
jgi:tetratricopeptide (TPR) repeat protein